MTHRQNSVRVPRVEMRPFEACCRYLPLAFLAIAFNHVSTPPSHGACTSENISHAGFLQNGTDGALLTGAQDVYISGNFAYVASRWAGALEVVDISDPANPVHVGAIQDGDGGAELSDPSAVFVAEGFAYLTSFDRSTFEIVDVSDPTNPTHAASLTDGQGGVSLRGAGSVSVAGDFAYITAFDDNVLEIIDVSNPFAPAHVSSFAINSPWSVFVDGDFAYVTSRHANELVIVNVSNPSLPVIAGSIGDGDGGAVFDSPTAVFVKGGYAYVAGENDFEIVDITNPNSPFHVGWTGTGLNSGETGLFIAGGYAFVAAFATDSLEVVNLFDPTDPQKVASLPNGSGGAMLGGAVSVFVAGDYAFVASMTSNALEVVDVFDFVIDCPPELDIREPNGSGDVADQNFTIEWLDSDDDNATVTLYYDTDRFDADGIAIPAATFAENDPADQFVWDTSAIPDDSYYVYGEIDDGSQVVVDYSFGPVTINHPDTPPTITILEPDGVNDVADQSYLITWDDEDPEDNAIITLFYDSDNIGEDGTQIPTGPIEEDDPTDQIIWDTSAIPVGNYYVYGRIDDGTQVVDYSSGPVTINHSNVPPSITILEPDGTGDIADQTYTISWEDQDPDDNATIHLFYDDDASGENGIRITISPIDEDDETDQFIWNTAGIRTGQYYVYAEIQDGVHAPIVSYSSGFVSVEHPLESDWTPTGLMRTPRRDHTSTLLLSGKVLITGGEFGEFLSSTELYDPDTGNWRSSGSMLTSRAEHTATLLPSGEVLVVGGWGGSGSWPEAGRSAEIFDPDSETWRSTDTLINPRQGHTATLLTSGRVLVAGGLGDNPQVVELYDPETNTWETSGSLNSPRYQHTATLLPTGQLLVAGGRSGASYWPNTEIYDPDSGTWENTGALNSPRARHTATLLPSGRVLVVGGTSGSARLFSAELFDPDSGSWAFADSLDYPRVAHTATLLPSGGVLVAGGRYDPSSDNAEIYDAAAGTWGTTSLLNATRYLHTATLLTSGNVLIAGGREDISTPSAELYSPSSGAWTHTDFLLDTREHHTATLLASGEALVAGGYKDDVGRLSSVELYDPDTDLWGSTRSLNTAREQHAAARLLSGEILVVGGLGDGEVLSSAEIYAREPATWTETAPLNTPRYLHTATLLPASGKVLVTGGNRGGDWPNYLSSCEVYDPATNSWVITGSMSTARERHVATLLPSGKVLVVGGHAFAASLSSAEIYDPVTETWEGTTFLSELRSWPTATLLPSGKVLVTGGYDGDNALSTAEIYDPATEVWATTGDLITARFRHTTTLLPTGRVLVVGGSEAEVFDPGTGIWQAAGPLAVLRSGHTATLLATGKVLVAGEDQFGLDAPGPAELYEAHTDTEARRPVLESSPETISHGIPFSISGLRFRGDSEADGGTGGSSATNHPLIQLRNIDSGNLDWLSYDPPSPPSSFWGDPIELEISEFSPDYDPGHYLLTVFTNGIPSAARVVALQCSVAIIEEPMDQEAVQFGTSATFTAGVQGARSVQWQKFIGLGEPGADEEGYADIDGAVGLEYTTPPVTAADAGTRYRIVVDSGCHDLDANRVMQTSGAATLSVFDDTPPIATVLSPNGGEYLALSEPGEPNQEIITWEMSDNIRICQVRVSLLFSADGGATYLPSPAGGGLPATSGPGGVCGHPGELGANALYVLPTEPPSGTQGSLYVIQVEVTDQAGNTAIARSDNPFFIVEPGTDFKTLILANLTRMEDVLGFETGDLETHLRDLANHPQIRGLLIDLGADTDLGVLYAAWDLDPSNMDRANQILFGCHPPFPTGCASELDGTHDLLRDLLRIYGDVESVVLVGDDRVIPMARIEDGTVLLSEESYLENGNLTDATTVGKALAANMYLSDDPLAVLDPIRPDELGASLFIPDLAIGRLVENPSEIITTIATYISQGGVLDLSLLDADLGHKVQVTGYDFLQDCATRIREGWKAAFERPTASSSLAPVDGVLIGQSWDDQDLLGHLCGNGGAPYGLVSLNGHAVHYAEGIPGSDPFDIRGLEAADLNDPAACNSGSLDLAGSVLYAIGCHGGLSVAGSDPSDDDHSLDLPQTFLSRGAVAYLANSGYGWGLRRGIGYSERLVQLFTEEMSRGGAIVIGEAVKTAKLRYFLESPRFDPYDEKTLMQWTFFGLPMYIVDTGIPNSGSNLRSPLHGAPARLEELLETESFGGVTVERDLATAGSASGLETTPPDYLIRLPLHFDLNAIGVYSKYAASGEVIDSPTAGCPHPDGCYYALNGLSTGTADLPTQPYFIYDSRLSGTSQHGILWLGGEYREETDWVPVFSELISNGATGSDHGATPRLYHSLPTGLNFVRGEDPADCRPSDLELNSMVVTTGEVLKAQTTDPTYSIQRIYSSLDLEVLYYNNTANSSLNCDRGGPQFEPGPFDGAYHRTFATTVEWAVPVSHEAEVWRVVIVYNDGTIDSEGRGRWIPVELADDAGTWRGGVDIAGPARLTYMVQAVDRRGNITWLEFTTAELPSSGVPLGLPDPIDIEIPMGIADLSVRVGDAPDPVQTGSPLIYTLTVENLGPDPASSVTATSSLPPRASAVVAAGDGWSCTEVPGTVTCDRDIIDAGTSAPPISVVLIAPQEAGSIASTAAVSALQEDPNPANDMATEATEVDSELVCESPTTEIEVGRVTLTHEWVSVPLHKSFARPIVVAKPASHNDADPTVVRLRNVTPSGFEIRLQEWDYLDGAHANETVSYLVVERGSWLLPGGGQIEAGSLITDHCLPGNDPFVPTLFTAPFSSRPLIFSVVGTVAGNDTVVPRHKNVTQAGFEIVMQEQESGGGHAAETIYWIAWTPGTSSSLDPLTFEAGRQAGIRHRFTSIDFDSSFPEAPCLLADIQTFAGRDTANLRFRDLTSSSVRVQLDEEQSLDSETRHNSEEVGWLAFVCP